MSEEKTSVRSWLDQPIGISYGELFKRLRSSLDIDVTDDEEDVRLTTEVFHIVIQVYTAVTGKSPYESIEIMENFKKSEPKLD